MAAYTRCLRCAGAPRLPASGSELSLSALCRHVVPCDPGELVGCMTQFFTDDIGLRPLLTDSALSMIPASTSTGGRFRGFHDSPLLRPDGLPPSQCGSDSPVRADGDFLLPGFHRLGRPHRRWV